MPDYGVDTPAWSPLAWSWAAERLHANRNFWVVTVSGDGRPSAMPVWGVWDDGCERFAFSCGRRSRKARNLAANDRAVVMVDDTVECLSVEGRAAPVGDEASLEEWVQRYVAKYQPVAPELTADFVRQGLVIGFRPERAFAVIETPEAFSTRATRWVFEADPPS